MVKKLIILAVACTLTLNVLAIQAKDGKGCMDDKGSIFQIVRNANHKNGITVYENYAEVTESPEVCYRLSVTGACFINGRKTKYKEVFLTIVECPFNGFIVPLIGSVVVCWLFAKARKNYINNENNRLEK
ncbi:hypothetical protein [Pedobacter sp. UC225_65]|uniref:hypothetical protein n=1 Tax=Pedobacter sp. UC225_65 TaxID=3350173 RepID=UPI003672394E